MKYKKGRPRKDMILQIVRKKIYHEERNANQSRICEDGRHMRYVGSDTCNQVLIFITSQNSGVDSRKNETPIISIIEKDASI
jgi:transposase